MVFSSYVVLYIGYPTSVKVELILQLIKHYATNRYGRLDISIAPSFLASVLSGSKFLVSCSSHLTPPPPPRMQPWYTLHRRLVGPQRMCGSLAPVRNESLMPWYYTGY
jgi:hypothetical protein